MRTPLLFFAAVLWPSAALFGARAAAQEAIIPAEQHVWGATPIGSWKTVRVITETFDPPTAAISGTTVTETKSTLVSTGVDRYTLEVEVTLDVDGKRFNSPPQRVTRCYVGHSPDESPVVRKLNPSTLVVDDTRIPVEVHEITFHDGDATRTSTIYYSQQVQPHVMRQVSVAAPRPMMPPEQETVVEVIALDMPYKVLSEVLPTSAVKTVHRRAEGTTTTIEWQTPLVPGGIVAHHSKEIDAQGRLVRRSTLEVLDYGLGEGEGAPPRRGLFRRDRTSKEGKDSNRERERR